MVPIRPRFVGRLVVAVVVLFAVGMSVPAADNGQGIPEPRPAAKSDKSKERAESLGRILSHLGLGKGATIAKKQTRTLLRQEGGNVLIV